MLRADVDVAISIGDACCRIIADVCESADRARNTRCVGVGHDCDRPAAGADD